MCSVSAIYDYGSRMPGDFWNERQHIEAFQKLIEDARKFDEITRQPDCEDPAKAEWLKELLAKIDAMNKANIENTLPPH